MKYVILLICLLFAINVNAQDLDSVKHVIVVTKLQDTMALINKNDINKINKAFYEKDILDSLNKLNDSIIYNLNNAIQKRDTLLVNYQLIKYTDSLIKIKYQAELQQQMQLATSAQKEIIKQKTQKYVWEGISGGLTLALLLVLFI